MTIVDAVSTVLAENSGRAMTVDEIYSEIVKKNLFSFNAKSPQGVLRTQIRRHCQGIDSRASSSKRLFLCVGNTQYRLL